jgi:hypothetical protein
MKPKVYLSKSNACSALQLACVRKYLSELDVEVLEYESALDFKSNLKQSHYLIVLPPRVTSEDSILIGKGQTLEIESFLEHSYSSQIFVITDAWESYGSPYVFAADYLDLEMHNRGKDWTKYSTMTFDLETENDLIDFLETSEGDFVPKKSASLYTGTVDTNPCGEIWLTKPGDVLSITSPIDEVRNNMYLLIG